LLINCGIQRELVHKMCARSHHTFASVSSFFEILRAKFDRSFELPYSLPHSRMLFFVRRVFSLFRTKELPLMEWTTPKHEEIDLNCEVSSYANAEL
jgi:hypothetical protein